MPLRPQTQALSGNGAENTIKRLVLVQSTAILVVGILTALVAWAVVSANVRHDVAGFMPSAYDRVQCFYSFGFPGGAPTQVTVSDEGIDYAKSKLEEIFSGYSATKYLWHGNNWGDVRMLSVIFYTRNDDGAYNSSWLQVSDDGDIAFIREGAPLDEPEWYKLTNANGASLLNELIGIAPFSRTP